MICHLSQYTKNISLLNYSALWAGTFLYRNSKKISAVYSWKSWPFKIFLPVRYVAKHLVQKEKQEILLENLYTYHMAKHMRIFSYHLTLARIKSNMPLLLWYFACALSYNRWKLKGGGIVPFLSQIMWITVA